MIRRALAVLLLAGCATGGSSVDAVMENYAGDRPGAAVLVIKDGRVVVRKGYGLANVQTREPVTPATNFRLASVTKQFTAAAILTLADEGKLRLDDKVKRWLPSLPAAADDITIEHLLTHTSGLIDYEDVMPEGTTEQLHDADVLRLLESQDKVNFKPGTSYRYSNSAYALLALIAERASGQSFATVLRTRIFEPLGMTNTVALEENVSTVAHRAYGNPQDQSLTSAVLGDGGVYSSIDDLAKWDAALDDPKYAAALTPQMRTGEGDVHYGYGWFLGTQLGQRATWHTGTTIGFRNAIVRFPEQRLTVIVLTNRNEGEPFKIALDIAREWIR